MSIDWQAILTTLGTTAVIVAAGAWTVQKILDHLASRNLESYRVELAGKTEREMEAYRSSLARIAHEQTELHTKRSQFIAELYGLLMEAEDRAEAFLDPRRSSGDPDTKGQLDAAYESLVEARRAFRRGRIYLRLELCTDIEKLFDAIHRPTWDASFSLSFPPPPGTDEDDRRLRRESWVQFRDGVTKILPRVEAEFRRVLGVAGDAPLSGGGA